MNDLHVKRPGASREAGRYRSIAALRASKIAATMALPCIVVISFLLNYINNDFSIHYHGDEKDKIHFILEGGGNFRHPLLMLHISRFVNWFVGFSDEQEVLVLARTVVAVFGAFIVLGTFLLSKRLLGGRQALLVAGATALLPILLVHAHYVKEDIIFTCFCIAVLCCLMIFIQERSRRSVILLGGSAGLVQFLKDNPGKAISEQYGLGPHDVRYLFDLRRRRIPAETKCLISSSFKYDRSFLRRVNRRLRL